MARRASVTKPLSVSMAPRRSSRKVRAERFGTAWARRVSQAQRGIGIGVSMGRNRRTSNTLQLRAVTLKGQQARKNLTPEGADKAAETLNSSYAESSGRILTDPTGERRNRQFRQHFRGLRSCQPNPSGESGLNSP